MTSFLISLWLDSQQYQNSQPFLCQFGLCSLIWDAGFLWFSKGFSIYHTIRQPDIHLQILAHSCQNSEICIWNLPPTGRLEPQTLIFPIDFTILPVKYSGQFVVHYKYSSECLAVPTILKDCRGSHFHSLILLLVLEYHCYSGSGRQFEVFMIDRS